MIGMAKQEKLPVAVAVWTPNAVLAAVGLVLMSRLERTGGADLLAGIVPAVVALAGILFDVVELTLAAVVGVAVLWAGMRPD